MAVTRINNNQITDASAGNVYLGINANTKIQNYSITAQKIANSLVYGSDLTVTGNLTVQGNTTAIDTTITTIEDPVIVLASMQTGSPTVDIGFLGDRGTSDNIAFVWNEANAEFVTAFTTTGETNTVISISSYADFHTANANIGNNVVVNGTTSLIGNILGDANITGTLTGGNIYSADAISATGNVTGGNINTAGMVSATASVMTGNVEAGGFVSAVGNVHGGNVLTAGYVSATGNVYGANFIGNVSGNVAAPGANTQVIFNDAGTANATSGFTFNKTANALFVGGDVSAGNLIPTANVTYSLGNNNNRWSTLYISGQTIHLGNLQLKESTPNVFSVFQDDGTTLTEINASVVSATGNTIAGNVATVGQVSATATITGGNLATGGTVSATGDVTGGNIATIGNVSATTNVIGGNLSTGGQVTATGNVTGGNVFTGGEVSATGTVTGGNIATGGFASATGNVTGANLYTGGEVSATSNITGANVNTAKVYAVNALTLTNGTGNINLNPQGNVVLGNAYINGLQLTPQQDGDAASKYYVDILASSGLSFHPAVVAATTGTLATATGGTITYTQPNGASNGIGAYLSTTGSFNLIDTANVQTVGTRILVKDEGNAVYNGVYTWSNATTIVRSTDTDQYGPDSSEALSLNDYFFVSSGNINLGTSWVVNAPPGVITFGSSNISFGQFSQSQVYNAGNGIAISGTLISAKTDGGTTTAFDNAGNIIVPANAQFTTPNIGAATGTSLSATGTVTGGNIVTGGTISGTGTITVGNVETGGTVSATGNITGGNLNTSGLVSATGDVTGGNVTTAGDVSATGNVYGANFQTSGSGGNITGANNVIATTISGTADVIGGNLSTGGTVSATGTATLGNVNTGGFVSATGNVTSGNVLTGGIVSASGNIYAANFVGNISGNISAPGANTDIIFNNNGVADATSGFTFDYTSNTVTVGANVDAVSFNGNVYSTTVSATGNIDSGNINISGIANITGNIYGGNLATIGDAQITGNLSGGNIYSNGQIQGGNIVISGDDITDTNGRVNFNSALDTIDFAVNGQTANILYINATTGTASFGSSTQTTNSIVAFNSTNSILMPVGNTAQRPSGVVGQFRFNTSINSLEVYSSTGWTSVGQPDFTLITDQQFNGDGTTTVFTLSANATTAGTIVSINGVQQIPVTAYAVSGVTLTFTEAPEVGDLIDVRSLVTTTTVYGISNSDDTASMYVVDGSPIVQVTGDLSVSGAILGGNINSTQIIFGSSNMSVVSSGGNIVGNIAGTTVTTISSGLLGVTGNISATGDVIATNFNNTSDARLKENVTPIENAESVVNALNGVGYDWTNGSGHAYGLIAQDVEKVVPEAVKTDENGIKSVNYSMLIPFLIETVKKQGEEIAKLKNK